MTSHLHFQRTSRNVSDALARIAMLFLVSFNAVFPMYAADDTVPVTLLMPRFGTVAKIEKTTGELQAIRRAGLQMKSKGTIDHMFVREGDRVSQGQILATLEMKHFQLGLDQAQSMAKTADSQTKAAVAAIDAASTGVQQAEVRLQTVTRDYERAKGLRDKDTIPQQQYDQIEGQYKLAIVGLEAAKKQLLQAKAGLEVAQAQTGVAEVGIQTARQYHDEASLIAPFAGLIVAKLVQENEPCGEKTLYNLIDDSELELSFRLPERFLPLISPGTSLSFTTPLVNDAVPASVTTVVPNIDAQSRTFLCKALIPNADHRFSNGGFVDVNVVVSEDRNVLVVPSFLIRNVNASGSQKTGSLFIEENGKARKITVIVGQESAGNIAILGGLTSGTAVIYLGNNKLEDGSPVAIQKSEGAPR
ncbi:MAG: efflux RND transporter periplasmic adaptor subunit [Candidatus Riflebacteria bacterium]|nr:efflux RND transporter periplasmic adaptor subunit [Candidatus Riflebacteria bacterium]